MATQKQLDLRRKLLDKAIKPTTDPSVQKKNDYRYGLLKNLDTIKPTAPLLGGRQNSSNASGVRTVSGDKKTVNPNSPSVQAALQGTVRRPAPTQEAPMTSPTDSMTFAEIGESLIQSEYDGNIEAELNLMGESKGYTSLDEYIIDQFNSQKDQKALQESRLNNQAQQLGEQTSDARNVAEGQFDASSPLVGSREGATSYSNLSTRDRLKTATNEYISRIQRDQNVNFQAINQAKADLARAEKAGNTELAAKYRSQLAAAEAQAKAIDTEYINALTQQATTEAQIADTGISSFQGLVESGVEMDYNTVSQYASQYGLPTDLLMGYYQGAQGIRNDKSLDQQAKQLALQELQYSFDQKLSGLQSEEAQRVSDYLKLAQSGQYSAEELQSFAVAMNIPNEKNPIYQAELKVAQADAKIKDAEANGKLINPLDVINLAQATYDYYESIGYDASIIPTGGSYGAVSYTTPDGYSGVKFLVQDGQNYDDPNTTRDESQCGAFVNDITGIGMGDTFDSKMALVDQSIKVPAAGMVYVVPTDGPYAPYGHTGMVEYFNPETGMVGVVSANAKGDGTIVREELPLNEILNGGGFALPPSYEQGGVKQYSTAQTALMSSLDPKDLSSTDLTLLEQNGLSSSDLFSYVSSTKQELPADKREDIQQVYDALLELKEAKGQSGAVGMSWSKLLGFEEGIPGSNAAGFIAKFNTFRDSLAIPNLENMKGALSDKDIQFLRNTATSLSLNMSEEEFNNTLDKLEQKYSELLNQGTDITGGDENADDPLNLGFTSAEFDPLGLND